MMSLTRRMILSASLVLAVFLVMTALALDRAFYDSARSARQERLLGQVYLLIAAAEVDIQGHLGLPDSLSESRFALPGSGLYAAIFDQNGALVWRSPSAVGMRTGAPLPHLAGLAPGEKRFKISPDYFVQSLGVKWAVARQHYAFTFSVSEDRAEFNLQIRRYRQSLWGWLAALALLLLFAQAAVLRWGLRPLRSLAGELNAIESGRQENLQGVYPEEIQRLTDNLNSLLQHEREQRLRYRNALADLAHSLKTPLAVMRGALSDSVQLAATVEEQVARMDTIVAYQLQRAVMEMRQRVATSAPILPLAEKIIAALRKVYRDKAVQVEIAVDQALYLAMDEGDLMELFGNLLENAFKWCTSRVQISANATSTGIALRIEDDGPGIDPSQLNHILQRGVRADETVPGHGIGLAVARDIVAVYQGEITLGRSHLGGAAVNLIFPQ